MKHIYILFTLLLFSILFVFCSGSSDTSHNRKGGKSQGNVEISGDPDGKDIYKTYCKLCHGAKGGLGINGAANLKKSEMSLEERVAIIKDGKTTMTPFKGVLNDEEIKAVAEYSLTLVKE